MKIISQDTIKPFQDTCGKIKELYASKGLSFTIVTVIDKFTPHKHLKTEEVYFVIKGQGKMILGKTARKVTAGDLIPIPLGEYHTIEPLEKPLKLIVISHPKYDPNDVILK